MSINYPCSECSIVGHIKVNYINGPEDDTISVKKICNNDCDLYRDWLISERYIDINTVQEIFHAYNAPSLAHKCKDSCCKEGKPESKKSPEQIMNELQLMEVQTLRRILDSVPTELVLQYVAEYVAPGDYYLKGSKLDTTV